ncbi:argininosuccinate lyase [Granulicella sp. 5B5]|uniref:argininosuccinate lyase n=1 Tax=Granulicella sp. 5B5 TaxID=1617967 RepID=UPI0015F3845C|nr:argininosuccinate lyase [Granulicella sp. 5B5]QMV17704.1 argininosuccinate lyase [Granulicella sp. 5B5]
MSNEPTKMWSGRFREPLNRTFEQWQRSFPFDWRLLPQEVAASKAHAQTIAAAGILTPEELETTLRGLTLVGERAINWSNRISATSGQVDYETSDQQIGAAIVASAPQAEDIHHFVELELTKEIGALALKLHTGRSRNEQIATDMRLFVRDAIDSTLTGLRDWLLALITLAEKSGTAVMPGYTHLQRAEPVLIAHWLLAYVSMLERDHSRFTDARTRMNLCPLGSGAIAGATLALDRTIASKALAFTAPTPNSMDATSDRDFMLDFAQAATTLGLHISRFAEELTLYATSEFGFIDLPEAFSTGSSAMPQKKNPDLTELARGKSARLLGSATALATLIKGLPLAYNKDLQEGQEQIFDVADTLTGLLSVLPNFTRALTFKPEVMTAAAQTGYLNAMAAATYLSNKGVPFRKAHEIVGNAVRLGLEMDPAKRLELNEIPLPELQQLSEDFAEDFFDSISLRATLDCHDVIGGTATHRVAEALTAAKTRVAHLISSVSSEDHVVA